MESFDLSFASAAGRPVTTQKVTAGAGRLLVDLGLAALMEVTLPNGRRADLIGLSRKGEFVIVEVKSSREDFLTDQKWRDYIPYCDRFYFAVAPEFPRQILPEDAGWIAADAYGGAILRESGVTALAPARRKALTIAFARLAAFRRG